jgi:valyl-tRNA synthetase
LIEQIRSVRSEMNVNAGAKLPLVQLQLDGTGKERLERNKALIERLARVSEFASATDAPDGSVTLPVPGGAFCLPLADVIDVSAEKARLEKAAQKLAKEIGGLNGKLNNEKFLAKAPQDVVSDQRDRLAAAQEEAAKIDAALARVAQMG